jgi:hypothetical protein
MTHDLLQQLFGTEPSKIYIYAGELVAGDSQVENITLKFADAAGTNLVSCVVTQLKGTYFVYTKDDYNIEDSNFIFVVDLPLPLPPEPDPVVVEEETPSEGTQ